MPWRIQLLNDEILFFTPVSDLYSCTKGAANLTVHLEKRNIGQIKLFCERLSKSIWATLELMLIISPWQHARLPPYPYSSDDIALALIFIEFISRHLNPAYLFTFFKVAYCRILFFFKKRNTVNKSRIVKLIVAAHTSKTCLTKIILLKIPEKIKQHTKDC